MSCPECGKVCGDMVSHIKVNHKGMDWRGIKTPCPFDECGKVLVDIQNHIRLVHLKIKNFECDHCDSKFSNRYQVRNHINGVHSNVREKCPQCDTMLKITTLKMHIRNVHEGGNQKVDCKELDCTKSFGSNADLERHVVSVHMKIKAPCPDCGKRFRMETLANHIKTQHKGIYPYMCKQCDKGFQNLKHLHIHVRTRHYGVFVFCKALNAKGEVCGKKLFSEEGLQKHINVVHLKIKTEDSKDEICPECGVTVLPVNLQRHIDEVHSKISNKPCPMEDCGEIFTNKYNLQRHVDKVHNKMTSGEWCDFCEEFKQDLKGHYKLVHMDHKRIPCSWPECTYQAKTPQYLEKHIKFVHERKTRVACDECGKSVRDLYDHKRSIHRRIDSHFCEECDKGFPTKSKLRYHVNKIHLQVRSTCDDCGAQVANLQQHKRFVHEKRMAAVCDVPGCDTTFANQLSKRKHMRNVHEGFRETCPECGKQVSALRSHIKKVHEKERPHECPECKKTFQTRTHLRNHLQRVHLGLRVKCEDCGKMVQDLRNHRNFVHLGVKNFPCDQCETRCVTSTALKLHILSVHLGVKEKCDICNKEVAPTFMKKHIRDHIKTEEDKKPHICSQCDKAFTDPGSLKKHVLRTHLNQRAECPRCGLQTKDLYRHMKYTKCDQEGYTPRRLGSDRKFKQDPDETLEPKIEELQPRRLRDLDYVPGILQEPDFNRNTDVDYKEPIEVDFDNWGLVEEPDLQQVERVEKEVAAYVAKHTRSSVSSLSSGNSSIQSITQNKRKRPSDDNQLPLPKRKHESGSSILSNNSSIQVLQPKSKRRFGSGSSEAFHGFPSDHEDSSNHSLQGFISRRESIVTGSDIMELEEDDAFFVSEEESEVMKNKVEPVAIQGVEKDNATNDPLDIGERFDGKERGLDSGKRKKERGRRRSKLKIKAAKSEPKRNRIKDTNGIEVENITSEEDFSDSNFLL